jgi:MFS family permease
MGAASLAGRLVTGWMLDRFAPVRVSMLMLTIAAAGPFVLAGSHSLEAGLVAAVCLGFGSGGEIDVVPYLLSRYFMPSSSGHTGSTASAGRGAWPERPDRS